MLVTFETLPVTARIWIYQSIRKLTADEISNTIQTTENFLQNWTAHQADLKAGVQILFNHFIIIGVDENYNDASGCSIDKKVNFMKQVGNMLQVDLFNRMQVAYIENDLIQFTGMHELAGRIKIGELPHDVIMFNNLVATKKEFESDWKVAVRNSWMQQLVIS